MEEKELNLCEILKGYEGDIFYSPAYGDVALNFITDTVLGFSAEFSTDEKGRIRFNKEIHSPECMLYPSRDLYLKYPLDAKKAWGEWIEANKPKRWRAQKGDNYYFFDRTYTPYPQEETGDVEDDLMYESYNYFRTEFEAKEAAEAVKKCLEEFHSKYNQQ